MWNDIRQALDNCLLAGITLLLPWPLAFRVLRFLTRFGLGAFANERRACEHMLQQGFAMEPVVAVRRMRLHRLLDLADFYKSRFMHRGWLQKFWRISGDTLPDAASHPAVLFVTFHYGAGFWALRHFHEHGLSMAALYRPPPRPVRWGEYWESFFFWRRLQAIGQMSGAAPIRVGDERSELSALVRRLVRKRQPLGVMPDIPTDSARGVPVRVLGKTMYFAAALLRLVVKHQVPVVLYTSTPDLHDGGRDVVLHVLYEHASVEALAARLAEVLEQALCNDPTAWHLWAFAEHILHAADEEML